MEKTHNEKDMPLNNAVKFFYCKHEIPNRKFIMYKRGARSFPSITPEDFVLCLEHNMRYLCRVN